MSKFKYQLKTLAKAKENTRWADVPGYEGLYQISQSGVVLSVSNGGRPVKPH